MAFNDSNQLRSAKLVLAISDFAGYTRAFAHHDDVAMARFIDQFYCLSVETITRFGGRVIKFMGDACLSVFDEDAGARAVDAMLDLRQRASKLTASSAVDLALGARVHCGLVVEGHFGPPDHSRYDVIGAAVNATALMGAGSAMWISDPVYQQLDEDARLNWERDDATTTYRFEPPQA